MGTLYDWSTTAASNGSADATVNFAEGQLAPTLNNSARALMARVKAWSTQLGGASSGGSSNAYTYTSPSGHAFTALVTGSRITFKANHTNTGAATLAVDGLTATAIRKTNGATALAAGDLVSGQIYDVVYDGTFWVLLGIGAGGFQPLDATLTALAALSTSADQYIYATGADTFALATVTSAARSLLADASVPRLSTSNVFTAQASRIGSNAGSYTSPTNSNTNLLLYNLSSTNYAGIGADSGGDVYVVNGTSSPVTRLRISSDGNLYQGTTNVIYHAGNLPGTAITWTAAYVQSAASVVMDFRETGVSANAGNWRFQADAEKFELYTINDALNSASLVYSITRSGLTPTTFSFTTPVQAPVAVSSETSGTLTSASRNKQVRASGGVTIPASVMTTDDIIIIRGMGTARTITRGSGLTMYVNGVDSATATLTARGTMSVVFDSATVCTLHGDVS